MIEYTKDGILRTKVYYCDAGCPHQKGSIEVNHELIRRVLPKGVIMLSYEGIEWKYVVSQILKLSVSSDKTS